MHRPSEPAPLPPAVGSMTLLAAAVLVHDEAAGRVLLLQRGPRAKFAPLLWDLPVGKVEPGESVRAGAVRELAEETGVEVDPAGLDVVHVVHGAHSVESPNGYLTVVFRARSWRGEPRNREPAKHARVAWTDVGGGAGPLPPDMVPGTSDALRQYLSGGPGLTLRGF